MDELKSHEYWMKEALKLARQAKQLDEVPIGAILVKNNQLIASAYNMPITNNNPCAHAEVLTLEKAGNTLKNYRLIDTILYVTLEPCCMCFGALIHARVNNLIFGAFDPKSGACGSMLNLNSHQAFNHKLIINGGILEEECSSLIKDFFKAKRKNS